MGLNRREYDRPYGDGVGTRKPRRLLLGKPRLLRWRDIGGRDAVRHNAERAVNPAVHDSPAESQQPDVGRVVEFENQRLPADGARFRLSGSQEDPAPGPGIQISIAPGAGGAAQGRWANAKLHHYWLALYRNA